MKIKVGKTAEAPPIVASSVATEAALEATEVKEPTLTEAALETTEIVKSPKENKFQTVSQSIQAQQIEVIKSFNGLKVGHKMTVSKNVAEVLILKNLVK